LNNEKLIRKFNRQAKMYEMRRKKNTEKKWREKLISCAKGKVLEVAVGAGANFHFYPQDVEVTAVDFSEDMLRKAKESAVDNGIQAEFIQSDVEALSFPDGSFDTIVSTLSFCGYEDPNIVLKAFQKWCKPNGQILLMEHGISSNRLVGILQSVADPLFKKVVGCHLNRDIIQILQESNIHIHKVEHYMLSTVHLIWAAPKKL
jgi:ubiquinone/menaquinone biosynthesis C-methylase UbiE